MKYPQNIWKWQGKKVLSIWIRTSDIKKYHPIEQVYGIVFNNIGKILIARCGNNSWNLPGGHPEKGESYEETLKRELLEEADVEIENIIPLGVQKAISGNDIKKAVYQARFVASIKRILPQTPDPANGNIWQRIFVPADKVNSYIKWGEVGKAMFKDAIELYDTIWHRPDLHG
jgi:8-oxo-dGTP diphosphatase